MNFYKYYPENSSEYIFNNDGYISLRFSQPSAVNDIFEVDPVINYSSNFEAVREEVIKIQKNMSKHEKVDLIDNDNYSYEIRKTDCPKSIAKTMCDDRNNRYKSQYRDNMNKTFGILSLTTKYNNSAMWGIYSSEHRGFVIEIDFPIDLKIDVKEVERKFSVKLGNEDFSIRLNPQPVQYTSERPTIDEGTNDNRFLYIKDSRWSNEEEQRVVIPLYAFENTGKKDNKGLDIFQHRLPANKVKNIYLGKHLTKKEGDKILAWRNRFTPSTPILRQTTSSNSYNYEYTAL